MGSNIQVFQNPEFGKIRTTKINGNPWFVAKDVCNVLSIVNHNDAISRLDEDEKGVATADPLTKTQRGGGIQKVTVISESGLYMLIFQSRKPFAKAFRKWVTNEVLPTIRKTGCYKVSYPYEKRIKHLENLREIDCERLELLQSWILNVQSERDLYRLHANACTEILCTRDFSESEMLLHAEKLLRAICTERKLPTSVLSKLIGKKLSSNILDGKEDISLSFLLRLLSTLDYSIQFVKNESLID